MKPDTDELKVFKYEDGWAVHHNGKMLCHLIKEWDFKIAYPVLWKTFSACEKWVNEGCIADIQEAHMNLSIVFTDKQLIMRE